jgi:uncharacterized lipoprotein
MRYFGFILMAVLGLAITGCSTVKKLDKSWIYKEAPPVGAPMKVPQDVKLKSRQDLYPVPAAENGSNNLNGEMIVPPGCDMTEEKSQPSKQVIKKN